MTVPNVEEQSASFAVLQLIPIGVSGITRGLLTVPLDPFGPSGIAIAHSIAITTEGSVILVGSYVPGPADPKKLFAALQLNVSLPPTFEFLHNLVVMGAA